MDTMNTFIARGINEPAFAESIGGDWRRERLRFELELAAGSNQTKTAGFRGQEAEADEEPGIEFRNIILNFEPAQLRLLVLNNTLHTN